MRGTFRQGDILLVGLTEKESLRPGDVIAFRQPQSDTERSLMVHRIRARAAKGFVTQGDNQPLPDPNSVCPSDIVGRVRFVRRDGRTRRVWGGRAGQLWMALLRLWRRIRPLGRWPYSFLRRSGLVRMLWRPVVLQVHLTTERGELVKYVTRERTVARWLPEQGSFWCRKPYDLVLEPPRRPGQSTAVFDLRTWELCDLERPEIR